MPDSCCIWLDDTMSQIASEPIPSLQKRLNEMLCFSNVLPEEALCLKLTIPLNNCIETLQISMRNNYQTLEHVLGSSFKSQFMAFGQKSSAMLEAWIWFRSSPFEIEMKMIKCRLAVTSSMKTKATVPLRNGIYGCNIPLYSLLFLLF